jgi:hypothetical protein
MNLHTRRSFLALVGIGAATASAAAGGANGRRLLKERVSAPATKLSGPAVGSFVVFDGLLYKPMPDLRTLKMPKLLAVGDPWRPGISHDEVDPAGITTAVRWVRQFTDTYYFDVENWAMSNAPQPVIDANIQKFKRVAEIARLAAPDGKFGFYGIAPERIYWPIIRQETEALARWRDIDARSADFVAKVDFLFPSLYTFYDDLAGWETYARAMLKQARLHGKPVYPFLWPQFHNSNAQLKGQKIPGAFWRRQLELCREYADGIVLWGGYTELWDEEADWWVETKVFVDSLRHASQAQQPEPPTNVATN